MGEETTAAPIGVIGTGKVGTAIATVLLEKGHRVVIWNRSAERARHALERGAELARGPGEVMASASVTIICLSDPDACMELWARDDVRRNLNGADIIQVTTGAADDGRRVNDHITSAGGRFVDAAILAYPSAFGTPEAVILFSGDRALMTEHDAALRALATPKYLGEDPGLAEAMDGALFGVLFASVAGMIHGFRVARAEGIDLADFEALSERFRATFLRDALGDLGRRVVAGDHAKPEATLAMQLAGLESMVIGGSEAVGVEHGVMDAIRDMFATGVASGRGGEDFSVLAELGVREVV